MLPGRYILVYKSLLTQDKDCVEMDSRKTLAPFLKTGRKAWIKYLVIVLICEKIIQHIFVTLAFSHNWNGVRSIVAVNPDVLMVFGGIVAVLFAFSLWGILNNQKWVTSLLIGLALLDMIGECVAQGLLSIVITVSFLVATLLLILALIYRRQVLKMAGPSVEEG
jgi:hypothetical protein